MYRHPMSVTTTGASTTATFFDSVAVASQEPDDGHNGIKRVQLGERALATDPTEGPAIQRNRPPAEPTTRAAECQLSSHMHGAMQDRRQLRTRRRGVVPVLALAHDVMSIVRDLRLDPKLGFRRARDRLRSSLWFAPGVAMAAAIGLAVALVAIDKRLRADRDDWFLFDGGPESARQLLSTITTAMLTFTGLVFSITVLVLQLASNQFSPRVIRAFLSERITKLAMAAFVGTLVYGMIVLSQVRTDPVFVPGVATWIALLMVIVSVAVFIAYIHQMAHSIRAITVISKVAAETRAEIDRMFPCELAEPAADDGGIPGGAPSSIVALTGEPGVVAFIHADRLMEMAERCQAVIEIVPRVGDFVPTDAPLLRVWGHIEGKEAFVAAFAIEGERTMDQDPAFGFRQLVDVAIRALSPGINDPTTAVQALDHLHDLVRRLTVRNFPARSRAGPTGLVRVIAARYDFEEYVTLAFDEIRFYGASSSQVRSRLRGAINDCAALASPERARILERFLRSPESDRAIEAPLPGPH